MDGPFVTLLPFTNGDDMRLFLVYDVINSVLREEEGYIFNDSKRHNSNWTKILEHGQEYFPFFNHLEFIAPIYGSRPIPLDISDDSRQTRIKAHEKKPGVYSMLEGKFISAPLTATKLVSKIRSDGLIK